MLFIEDKRIFLVDILGILYKLYFIYNDNIFIYFKNYIKNIIINYNPNLLIFIFDTRLKYNYKKKKYFFYKNNRKKNIFLKKNIKKIYLLLNKYNIYYIYKKGYEADDIISLFVKYFKKKKYIIYIISNDKDFYQLLDYNIFICNYNGKIIDKYYILNIYNIKSIKKILDINILIGDYSDNIYGFNKIGFKKSIYFINKYKNLNNILKIKNINNFLIKSIINNKNKIFINKKLLSFNKNINIKINIIKYKFNIIKFILK
ncbi:MAG: 5'-3' exonuclease H3TH domain-containing protein [Candidatus Shikimatogenerans sp. Tcar]|uniref:5'-3' exonuclease H3TH domain-containing protein n=1 Tax=Candidatus Shikimatogenerans sp. Tcar TaxID=3158565 RepID=A0AAU7QSF1_9FLAO